MNMWSLWQKISDLTSIYPNMPALKYGRDVEQHASNVFFEICKRSHIMPRLSSCGLFFDGKQPFSGARPDVIVECACHGRTCLEIKCFFNQSQRSNRT